jgi:hypothetical protein
LQRKPTAFFIRPDFHDFSAERVPCLSRMLAEAGVTIIHGRIWRDNKPEEKKIVKPFF